MADTAHQPPQIRLAEPHDIEILPGIERSAARLFRTWADDLGLPRNLLAEPNAVDTFRSAQQAGRLWVACDSGGTPVGFALVVELGGFAHLDELDVLPEYGRQGVGSALLATVCAWARQHAFPAVTLRTFRRVPWNAPFYGRRGFREVDSATLSIEHARLDVMEQQRGLRPEMRVTMAYDTSA